MKTILAVLLFVSMSFATETIISGTNTVRVVDNRLIGPASLGSDTFLNKGAGVDALIGFSAAGANTEYGRYALWVHAGDTLPDGDIIDSVVIRLYNQSVTTSTVEVFTGRIACDIKEGTADAAYQAYSSSWRQKGGNGTMFNGVVRSGGAADTTGAGPSVWSGGNPTRVSTDETINVSTNATYYYFRPTDHVRDSLAVTDYLGFLFYDTLNQGSQERCRFATSEAVVDTQRPVITFYHHTPTSADSTWLLVSVTPPSSPLSNYPALVNFLTYPGNATTNISVYASDSTTKLYWWPDSMSGHYSRIWVMHDWSSSPDTIFIRPIADNSYRNSDSVFIMHDAFSLNYSVSQPITSWDAYTGVTFDTNGVMLANVPSGVDSTIREPSGMIYDWQESDASKRWKWFYCGERTDLPGEGPSNRYENNFGRWMYASEWTGSWSTPDTVMYDSSGLRTPANFEDPDITWLPGINKWAMYVEDHDVSATYRVSVFLADSLDQDVWVKRFLPVFDAQGIGTPPNWLDKEQASPTIVWVPTRDTLAMFFEAFKSTGESWMGLALSFSNGTGDTLGLNWYLTDSTGALNASNPMPIVPWLQPGQKDSIKTIPDAAVYLNGHYAVFSHGAGPIFWYYGDSFRNLTYQGQADSTHLAEVLVLDTASGDYISTYLEDVSDDIIRARARDFDSTRFGNLDWTAQFRANKPISTNRWLCGELSESNGILTMYPPQRQTGAVSIQSDTNITGGFVADIWAQCSGWSDGEAMLIFNFGSDTLQDASGTQTQQGAWYNPQIKSGYSVRIHPTNVRFYRNDNGAVATGLGSAGSVGEDVIKSMHKYSIYYTSGDSLKIYVDGVQKTATKDVTYNAQAKSFTISQGERGEFNRGGVLRIDSLRIRAFTTADISATASDTLYALSSVSSENKGWNMQTAKAWAKKLRNGWRK